MPPQLTVYARISSTYFDSVRARTWSTYRIIGTSVNSPRAIGGLFVYYNSTRTDWLQAVVIEGNSCISIGNGQYVARL